MFFLKDIQYSRSLSINCLVSTICEVLDILELRVFLFLSCSLLSRPVAVVDLGGGGPGGPGPLLILGEKRRNDWRKKDPLLSSMSGSATVWVILKDTCHFCTKRWQVALPKITRHIAWPCRNIIYNTNDARTHTSYMLGSSIGKNHSAFVCDHVIYRRHQR